MTDVAHPAISQGISSVPWVRRRFAIAQRMAVHETLATAKDHPRADDIFSRACEVVGSTLLATVYQTLSALKTVGIVRKLTTGDTQACYALQPQSERDHLLDIDTGEIIEMPNEEIIRLHRQIAGRLSYGLVNQHTVLRVRRRKG